MTACGECLVERHHACPHVEVADVVGAEPPEYDDGTVEEGEYEAVTQFCCCGEEWTFVRETVASEYARMEEHLKPLQWPDMEQPS